ncbi:hypothetical protein ACEUVX_01595 [Staphylococcus pseudintermedius]
MLEVSSFLIIKTFFFNNFADHTLNGVVFNPFIMDTKIRSIDVVQSLFSFTDDMLTIEINLQSTLYSVYFIVVLT